MLGHLRPCHSIGTWAAHRGFPEREFPTIFPAHVHLFNIHYLRLQFRQTVNRILSPAIGRPHQMEAFFSRHARLVDLRAYAFLSYCLPLIVFIAMFTIGSTFAIIFQCVPVQAGWDFTLRPPTG
jgi:hypothetical protein